MAIAPSEGSWRKSFASSCFRWLQAFLTAVPLQSLPVHLHPSFSVSSLFLSLMRILVMGFMANPDHPGWSNLKIFNFIISVKVFSPVSSYSQVLGVRVWVYFFRGHHSTHEDALAQLHGRCTDTTHQFGQSINVNFLYKVLDFPKRIEGNVCISLSYIIDFMI